MSIFANKNERTPLWAIILAVIFLFVIVKCSTTKTESEKKDDIPITYQEYDIDIMLDELENNALSASEKYKGKNIEIKGKLETIDSSGKYISVKSITKNSIFSTIRCDIKDDSQKTEIMKLNKGDVIIVKGKIKSVGEIIGYSLDISEIQKE